MLNVSSHLIFLLRWIFRLRITERKKRTCSSLQEEESTMVWWKRLTTVSMKTIHSLNVVVMFILASSKRLCLRWSICSFQYLDSVPTECTVIRSRISTPQIIALVAAITNHQASSSNTMVWYTHALNIFYCFHKYYTTFVFVYVKT